MVQMGFTEELLSKLADDNDDNTDNKKINYGSKKTTKMNMMTTKNTSF